jgi:hypothetical protein
MKRIGNVNLPTMKTIACVFVDVAHNSTRYDNRIGRSLRSLRPQARWCRDQCHSRARAADREIIAHELGDDWGDMSDEQSTLALHLYDFNGKNYLDVLKGERWGPFGIIKPGQPLIESSEEHFRYINQLGSERLAELIARDCEYREDHMRGKSN